MGLCSYRTRGNVQTHISSSLALPLWVAAFGNQVGWEQGAARSQTAPQGFISHEDGYQSVQMSSTFSTAVLTHLNKTP